MCNDNDKCKMRSSISERFGFESFNLQMSEIKHGETDYADATV